MIPDFELAWKYTTEIVEEAFCNVSYFVKNNLTSFANVLNFVLPYGMYFIGQYVAGGKIELAIDKNFGLLIPLAVSILIYYLRSMANKFNRGLNIPVPKKRFTQVDDDGEVSIENSRIQELILYLGDLEDWMERKGML